MTDEELFEFKKELKTLLEKYKVEIGAEIDGDTHGITSNFVVETTTRPRQQIVLAWCGEWLSPSDLEEK